MEDPKPGEIVTDGRNVTIGAPVARAVLRTTQAPPPPMAPSQVMGELVRHLKGIVAAGERFQQALEEQEKRK